MPDSTSTKEPTSTASSRAASSASATDECPNCHSLRGSAPEGLYDVHSAFNTDFQPGDPKWQSSQCWKCGAAY